MNNNFDELSDEMLEGVAGGANIKRVVTTGISALMATFCVSGSITSVGDVDERKVNQILKNIDNCDNRIKDLEQNKARINEQKENEIKKLDSEIKDREQLLEYLLNLINSGEAQQDGVDNVKRGIEDNKKKKKQISDDRDREINDLNQKTKIEETKKAKLEKELDDLFKEKEEKKEKLALARKNAVIELKNYTNWLKEKGLSLKDNNLHKQLVKSVIKAREIAIAAKFDAKAAREIVAKLGVVLKDIEEFKKDFEAKKKLEAMQKLLERKANQAKYELRKKDKRELLDAIKEAAKEKEKEKAAINITDEKFEELLAGNQHVGNERKFGGKKWTIHNTCGIHMLTTLKNIYDYVDGKREGFVQGFKNVIENYLANGGDKKLLYTPIDNDNVGQMLMSGDFRGFLQNNKIGMHRVNFFHMIELKNQNEIDNYKNKLKEKIKSFLVNYMEGKNFAPIATVAGGHWQLLAKYDKQTNQILRLDSAPAEAKWVDIDTIAMNFIHVDNGIVEFEMPIFTKTEGISDINIDGVDDFTLAKQQEIIKNIG